MTELLTLAAPDASSNTFVCDACQQHNIGSRPADSLCDDCRRDFAEASAKRLVSDALALLRGTGEFAPLSQDERDEQLRQLAGVAAIPSLLDRVRNAAEFTVRREHVRELHAPFRNLSAGWHDAYEAAMGRFCKGGEQRRMIERLLAERGEWAQARVDKTNPDRPLYSWPGENPPEAVRQYVEAACCGRDADEQEEAERFDGLS